MKCSWVIPVFNSGTYLEEAVGSLLENQVDGVQFEILIVDDCSSDPCTLVVLEELKAYSQVSVIHQEKNSGPARARNIGVAHASGEWVGFLDADDMLVPGAFAMRLELIKAVPTAEWIAGDMFEIRILGENTFLNNFKNAKVDGVQVMPNIYHLTQPLKKIVRWGMLPFLGSMMFKRELLLRIGPINETLLYGEDIHFCLLTATFADLYWIETPLLLLRRYHESMTKDLLRAAREAPRGSQLCMSDKKLRAVRREMRWNYAANLRQSSKVFLEHQEVFEALKYAALGIFWSPNDVRSHRTLLNIFKKRRSIRSAM